MRREVRRDYGGAAVGCAYDGCYQAALEPDGRCERHGQYGAWRRDQMANDKSEKKARKR